MGRTQTPTYRIEYYETDNPCLERWCAWDPTHGRPTSVNLGRWAGQLNASYRPGGVNAHLWDGTLQCFKAQIRSQKSGRIVARYPDPHILRAKP